MTRVGKWEWRKRYRVWEASRKVFVYPENWLEPEPRSPLAALRALAAELDRSLFRVDLSGVVSKCIGDTEKNLDKIFRAAERAGAVLLLDEADALIGKRTNVKDKQSVFEAYGEHDFFVPDDPPFGGLCEPWLERQYEVSTAPAPVQPVCP